MSNGSKPPQVSADAKNQIRDEMNLMHRAKNSPEFWSALLKEKKTFEESLNLPSDFETQSLDYRPYMGTSPYALIEEVNDLALSATGRPLYSNTGRRLTQQELRDYKYPAVRSARTHPETGEPLQRGAIWDRPQHVETPPEVMREQDKGRQRELEATLEQEENRPSDREMYEQKKEREQARFMGKDVANEIQKWLDQVTSATGILRITLPDVPHMVAIRFAQHFREMLLPAEESVYEILHSNPYVNTPIEVWAQNLTPEQVEFYKDEEVQALAQDLLGLVRFREE